MRQIFETTVLLLVVTQYKKLKAGCNNTVVAQWRSGVVAYSVLLFPGLSKMASKKRKVDFSADATVSEISQAREFAQNDTGSRTRTTQKISRSWSSSSQNLRVSIVTGRGGSLLGRYRRYSTTYNLSVPQKNSA